VEEGFAVGGVPGEIFQGWGGGDYEEAAIG